MGEFIARKGLKSLGTTTLEGATTVSDDLTVSGNLTVLGTTTTLDTQTVLVKDNVITLNEGETGAGVTAGVSGLEVDRGTETNYRMIFDEATDSFKFGETGSEQPCATREENPTNGNYAQWNDTENRFDSVTIASSDLSDVSNVALLNQANTFTNTGTTSFAGGITAGGITAGIEGTPNTITGHSVFYRNLISASRILGVQNGNDDFVLDVFADGVVTTSGDINTRTGEYQLNGTSLNTAGALTNVAYLNQANTFTNTGITSFAGNLTAVGVDVKDASATGTTNTYYKYTKPDFSAGNQSSKVLDGRTTSGFGFTLGLATTSTGRYYSTMDFKSSTATEDEGLKFLHDGVEVANLGNTGDLDIAGAFKIGGTSINTAGTLTNVAYLNQANTFSAKLRVKSAPTLDGTLLRYNALISEDNAVVTGRGGGLAFGLGDVQLAGIKAYTTGANTNNSQIRLVTKKDGLFSETGILSEDGIFYTTAGFSTTTTAIASQTSIKELGLLFSNLSVKTAPWARGAFYDTITDGVAGCGFGMFGEVDGSKADYFSVGFGSNFWNPTDINNKFYVDRSGNSRLRGALTTGAGINLSGNIRSQHSTALNASSEISFGSNGFIGAKILSRRINLSYAGNEGNLEFYTQNGETYADVATPTMILSGSGDLDVTGSLTTSKVVVSGNTINISTQKTPASATATGTKGDIVHDSNYIYVCVATNTWKRTAITTW